MYMVSKYVLLSTPIYNFFYWVREDLNFFKQIWGATGQKSLRGTGLIDYFSVYISE
jgi:hypothetical protein